MFNKQTIKINIVIINIEIQKEKESTLCLYCGKWSKLSCVAHVGEYCSNLACDILQYGSDLRCQSSVLSH